MNILGIIFSTNSTAALLQDGRIVASASEERFVRIKNTCRYPKEAVEFCIQKAGIRSQDLDHVALCGFKGNIKHLLVDYDANFSVLDKIKEQEEYWYPLLYKCEEKDFLEIFKHKVTPQMRKAHQEFIRSNTSDDFRTFLVKQHLGSKVNTQHYHHHTSHIYYGLFSRRYSELKNPSLVFCIEGFGDDANASVSVFENGKFRYLMKTDQCFIGRLYRYLTLMLGMKPNEHEFKVMGLAPYAMPYNYTPVLEIFRKTMFVDGIKGFAYRIKPPDIYFYFKKKLDGYRFDSIAGGLQKYTEEIICEWVRNFIKDTGIRNIVFSGGVAMNIKALMEVAKLSEVGDLWVGPSAGDESLAIGVCYYAWHAKTNRLPKAMENIYLGPDYSDKQIIDVFEKMDIKEKYRFSHYKNPNCVVQLLKQGKVVARCSGRMEFGARALGNRSIIADPRNPAIVHKINRAIKNRDFWMPFAPVILKERVNDYLVNPKQLSAPYMALSFETTKLSQKEIPAALHPADFTVRPQVLERESNPIYYDIIKAFEAQTGVGALLNTSFNLHGEPLVNTPQDAIYVFENSSLDAMILGNYLFEKK